MAIDPSIPLQAQQYNPMSSLSQALQPVAQMQQIQNMQAQQGMMQQETQSLGLQNQQSQMLQNERQAYTQAMQDPNALFKNPDGTIDYGKLQQWLPQHAPQLGAQFGSEIMQHAQAVNQYKGALSGMADSDMQRTNAVLHSAMGPNGQPIVDPGTLTTQLANLKPTLSGPGSAYVDQAIKAIGNSSNNPQALQTVLGQMSRDTTPASAQTQQMQGATTMINNGAATIPVATNGEYGQAPGTPGTAAPIPNQVGPDQRQQLVTDQWGNPTVQKKDANGNIVSGPGVSNPLGSRPLAPGDLQAIPQLSQERAQINNAAQQVPAQHFNNQQIINLASDTTTGPGSAKWSKFLGTLGLGSSAAGDAASQYQLIGHYVALQAQNNAQAMGVHTDAGQVISNSATGSPDMNRQALIQATKTNDALASGVQDFNQGMEAAIKGAGGDVRAKRDFQNAWSQSFDPTIYSMKNALQSGNKQEAAQIWNALPAAQQQELKQKQMNLINLTTTGHM